MTWKHIGFAALAAIAGGVLVSTAVYQLRAYSVALFIAVPFVIGFIGSALLRLEGPQPRRYSLRVAFAAALMLSLAFLTSAWKDWPAS